jgi:hypothetical protein
MAKSALNIEWIVVSVFMGFLVALDRPLLYPDATTIKPLACPGRHPMQPT